jgi:hypothetical protein
MTETHPKSAAEVIFDLIIALLTPMFLPSSGNNVLLARSAATETVQAFRTHSPADYLVVAQIVAFGLASLDSLNRAMAQDLPVALVLRLRGSAAATHRAGEQNRRALAQSQARADAIPPPPENVPGAEEIAAISASLEVTRAKIAAASAPTRTAPNQAAPRSRPPRSRPLRSSLSRRRPPRFSPSRYRRQPPGPPLMQVASASIPGSAR